jgi:integrase
METLRFKIAADSSGRVTVETPDEPRGAVKKRRGDTPRNPGKETLAGTGKVTIFGRDPGPWTVAWYLHEKAPRRRAMRSTWKKAKKLFDDKVTEVSNHNAAVKMLTPVEAAEFIALQQANLPTGKPLQLTLAFAVQLHQELPGYSADEIIRLVKQTRAAGVVAKPVPEIVDELLGNLQQDGTGSKWLRSLGAMLHRFAAHWQAPLPNLKGPDAEAWLRGLKDPHGKAVGIWTRKNHRAALVQLEKFAKRKNYLPATWNELAAIAAPKLPDMEITALDPEDLVKLIIGLGPKRLLPPAANQSLVPFIVFQAFAGIRTEELAPPGDGPRIDWKNVNLERRNIFVPKNVGKEGDRNIPISDNLALWIIRYRRSSGPICELSHPGDALVKAKKRAGIPAGKNETRNTLRKSFGSYRMMITRNIAQVADEMGNSPAMIKRHYKAELEMDDSQAQAWFAIQPPQNANVLPLWAWARKVS